MRPLLLLAFFALIAAMLFANYAIVHWLAPSGTARPAVAVALNLAVSS